MRLFHVPPRLQTNSVMQTMTVIASVILSCILSVSISAEENAEKSEGKSSSGLASVEVEAKIPKGPDVVLIASEERIVYEFRVNGQLTKIKVEPKNGRPYYLVPANRAGNFGEYRANDTLVAEWVIVKF